MRTVHFHLVALVFCFNILIVLYKIICVVCLKFVTDLRDVVIGVCFFSYFTVWWNQTPGTFVLHVDEDGVFSNDLSFISSCVSSLFTVVFLCFLSYFYSLRFGYVFTSSPFHLFHSYIPLKLLSFLCLGWFLITALLLYVYSTQITVGSPLPNNLL